MSGRQCRHAARLPLSARHDRHATELRTSLDMPAKPPDSGRRLLPLGDDVERPDLRLAAAAAKQLSAEPPDSGRRLLSAGHVVERRDLLRRHGPATSAAK
jgi:hypothetical protein